MRIDGRMVNWGVFFILLGAVPLAVRQGVVNLDALADWWRLWPLILVGIGLGIILRRTPAAFLGGLTVAATLGLMGGVLLAGGASFGFCQGQGAPFVTRQGTFSGSSADVSVELNCGRVHLTSAAGTGWSVAGTSSPENPPAVDADASGLSVRSPDRGGFGFGSSRRDDWTISLPRDVPVSLGLTTNAGTATGDLSAAHLDAVDLTLNAGQLMLNLGGASLGRIGLTVNAGAAKLTLPNASLTGEFQVNAGSVKFCVPVGVGLRLTTNGTFAASVNYASQGLTKTDDTWESADYSTATNKIDLVTNATAGSIELNPKDGCT